MGPSKCADCSAVAPEAGKPQKKRYFWSPASQESKLDRRSCYAFPELIGEWRTVSSVFVMSPFERTLAEFALVQSPSSWLPSGTPP